MKTNEGLGDRVLRVYLGVIIAGIGIYFNTIWAVLGVPVFVSGIVGVCPIYSMLKWNSISKEESELS
jgi:predicted ferric reductase